MKIYKLLQDVDNFRTCFLCRGKDDDLINDIINKCSAIEFFPEVDFAYDEENKLPVGDVSKCWGNNAYIINEKCCKVFENAHICAQYIRISKSFNILNNLKLSSGLDNENSEFKYFENDIVGIKKYSFVKTNYPPLFQVKLPNNIIMQNYYVTEEFIKIVEDNKLTGFLFEEVWDSVK